MNKNQVGITEIERPPGRPIFNGHEDYERCAMCEEWHLFGWECYHCTVVRRNIRKRGFVNPITPDRKYLAKELGRCRHCSLLIWERTRKQTFHPQCKDMWNRAKYTIYLANQLIWSIRKQGYYDLDGAVHPIAGMTDESILVAIGHALPLDIVYENKKDGGFRFIGVEFPGKNYPWKPMPIRGTLHVIGKYRAEEMQSARLVDPNDHPSLLTY
jgi:hypothetical protein